MRITILRSAFAIVALAALSLSRQHSRTMTLNNLLPRCWAIRPSSTIYTSLLTRFGGRVTGSDANRAAVAWAAEKLQHAEVSVTTEDFLMPAVWQENVVAVSISGDTSFAAKAVAKPFSTSANALNGPLIDVGRGTEADFERLADTVNGAWLLVETLVLDDAAGLSGLFAEYGEAVGIEARAASSGATGVVFMSSRPKNLVFRHNAAAGQKNALPLLVLEREHAKRAMRLLRSGRQLALTATIGVEQEENITCNKCHRRNPRQDAARRNCSIRRAHRFP